MHSVMSSLESYSEEDLSAFIEHSRLNVGLFGSAQSSVKVSI